MKNPIWYSTQSIDLLKVKILIEVIHYINIEIDTEDSVIISIIYI